MLEAVHDYELYKFATDIDTEIRYCVYFSNYLNKLLPYNHCRSYILLYWFC